MAFYVYDRHGKERAAFEDVLDAQPESRKLGPGAFVRDSDGVLISRVAAPPGTPGASMKDVDKPRQSQRCGFGLEVEVLARQVTNDMPGAPMAEKVREAMKRCRGGMNPRWVREALRDAGEKKNG